MTLYYEFPHIERISDVLPHIDDNFRIVDKGELTFINYIGLGKETFPSVIVDGVYNISAAIRRECRGIAFYTASGVIASRPFHKFFNAGERDDVALSMFDFGNEEDSHYLLDKLDGSMIRPLPLSTGYRWGTKMGVTDVGLLAETFVSDKPEYEQLAEKLFRAGKNPIFEFCSRDSQVVIDHPEDKMVLLAIRDIVTGRYASPEIVQLYGTSYDIPVVRQLVVDSPYRGELLATSIVQEAKELDDSEGYVLCFAGIPIAKAKSDWYVKIHRAKDMMRSERHLLALVVAETVDDLLPAVSDVDKARIEKYVDEVGFQIRAASAFTEEAYMHIRRTFSTKKDFALSSVFGDFDGLIRRVFFAVWDGKLESVAVGIKEIVEKSLTSEASFQEMKRILGLYTEWNGKIQVEGENDA